MVKGHEKMVLIRTAGGNINQVLTLNDIYTRNIITAEKTDILERVCSADWCERLRKEEEI